MNLRGLIFSLYLILFVAMAAAAGLFFFDAREEYEQLQAVRAENQRRLVEAEARLREEETVLDRLRNDPAYVEKVIRRKLGYAKPDEFIFRFEP